MIKWLFSKKNIVASLVASISLLLYFIGIIDKFWWAIVALSYIIAYLLTSEEKTIIKISGTSISLESSEDQLIKLISENKDKLPLKAIEELHQIQLNLNDLHFFMKKNVKINLASEELLSIENIFEKYLPTIINSYVRFPQRYAENVKIKNEQTTKDLLIEQLSLLNIQLQKMSHSIYESDAQAMVVNGRFLKEKFSEHEWNGYFANEKELNS